MKKKKTTIKDLEKRIKQLEEDVQNLASQTNSLNHDLMPFRPIGPCQPNQLPEDPKKWDWIKDIKFPLPDTNLPMQCQGDSLNTP